MAKPPSVFTKEMFENFDDLSEKQIEEIARAVLLPPEEVTFWIKHL